MSRNLSQIRKSVETIFRILRKLILIYSLYSSQPVDSFRTQMFSVNTLVFYFFKIYFNIILQTARSPVVLKPFIFRLYECNYLDNQTDFDLPI